MHNVNRSQFAAAVIASPDKQKSIEAVRNLLMVKYNAELKRGVRTCKAKDHVALDWCLIAWKVNETLKSDVMKTETLWN